MPQYISMYPIVVISNLKSIPSNFFTMSGKKVDRSAMCILQHNMQHSLIAEEQ